MPPSLSELAGELELASRSRVHALLCQLRERGYIAWLPHRRRSLVVLRPIALPEEPEIAGLFDAPELAARLAG